MSGNQAAKAINARLEDQLLTTRPGARAITVTGDFSWKGGIQGVRYYDPRRGTSAQVFSDDSASIFLAAGGRKYRIFPGNDTAVSEDVTGEAVQDEKAHLVWLSQAENYMIAGDGKEATYIFDGESASYSTGFVGTGDRALSSVPQGIRTPVYAHGRLWVVVDSRRILASDSLHGQNLTDSSDLIKFTEQTYWAEGQYFVSPSNMGNIIAAEILPLRDTRTGQGEIMFHCVNGGIFSINGNIYPRSSWSDTPMVNHFNLSTAASGPYAIDLQESDQIFLSRSGIQTLRSARAESRLLGRPLKPISEEVSLWLDQDYIPYRRFASLANWPQKERLLCTVIPEVQGTHTFSRGLVALNWDAVDSTQSPPAWEGLWTFPGQIRYIAKLVAGLFSDDERMFAFHYDGDGAYYLVEYRDDLKWDILPDGTKKPIEMKVETREVSGANPYDNITIASGSLHLRSITVDTTWQVNLRNHKDSCWTKWRSGEVCFDQCPDKCSLVKQQPRNVEIELGKPPETMAQGRRFQMQIIVTGHASIEVARLRIEKESDDSQFTEESLTFSCKEMSVCCDNGDFSYSE